MDKMGKMEEGKNYIASYYRYYSYSIMQGILEGGLMAAVGYNYSCGLHTGPKADGEETLCPNGNGAAYWLLIAGIVILISNSYKGCVRVSKETTEPFDDKISYSGKVSAVLNIAELAMLIWGSVVVFGAWATCTDDFDVYKANPDELNFCERIPMMTAFIILILNLVLVPIIIIITCLCVCCCGMLEPSEVV